MTSYKQAATELLLANDRGGFTIPTSRLYPYQWNWDSAFAALGFAVFDKARAWTELNMLFGGQWSDGMVPHIIFRQNDPDYFPGPTVWQTGTEPPSSGHSQPPVAASVVAKLMSGGDALDQELGAALFPKLFAYHEWFHTKRDPDSTGLVAIIHPWESGRDNCPDWDSGMNDIVVPDDLGDYERRDLNHVDAAQRPSSEQYDRFLSIVKFGREAQWDPIEIYRNGPFLMADPGVQFILMRADRDLLEIAEALNDHAAADTIKSWIVRSQSGCEALWNESVGGFCAKNLRTGEFSTALTSASMLCFYADAGTHSQQQQMSAHARAILSAVQYAFPSWDPRDDSFESKRYWRGPVWAIMNYMIAEGFCERGEEAMANRVRKDTLQLIDSVGYYEYFDPVTGEGLGGADFTWTAAIELALHELQANG